MTSNPWHAIVLAGGRASRLGGIDKTALRFEGMSLLEHALDAVADASEHRRRRARKSCAHCCRTVSRS